MLFILLCYLYYYVIYIIMLCIYYYVMYILLCYVYNDIKDQKRLHNF